MNNTEQKTMEESALAVVRFTAPPADAIRLACNNLALFPWVEGELAAQVLPAFLTAALGGVKACNGGALTLHITGGKPSARSALFATVRDMLTDSPDVVCVTDGTDSAGVAAAVRACPQARLLMLADAAPVKSALRYIVQNAGGVAVLAFSEDTFADDAGLHPNGAVELRLREYIDTEEERILAEYRELNVKTLFYLDTVRRAADALRAAAAVEQGRADITAAAVYDALRIARSCIDEALSPARVVALGTSAALTEYAENAIETDLAGFSPVQNAKRNLQGWSGYEVNPIDVIAPLSVCNPCDQKMTAESLRAAYAKSMKSARIPHPAATRFVD